MIGAVSFPYVQTNPTLGAAGLMPFLPLNLEFGSNAIQTFGLIDSGATNNVLPHAIGLQLGADWNRLPVLPPLGGILASSPSRAILVKVGVAPFAALILAFAWTSNPNAPLLLGQKDFFDFFDVCFHRSQGFFEIMPRP